MVLEASFSGLFFTVSCSVFNKNIWMWMKGRFWCPNISLARGPTRLIRDSPAFFLNLVPILYLTASRHISLLCSYQHNRENKSSCFSQERRAGSFSKDLFRRYLAFFLRALNTLSSRGNLTTLEWNTNQEMLLRIPIYH